MSPVGYRTVHARLNRTRGRARSLTCDCGEPAECWGYQHGAPKELRDPRGCPYTEDLDFYEPMCRCCHNALDRIAGPATARKRGQLEPVG